VTTWAEYAEMVRTWPRIKWPVRRAAMHYCNALAAGDDTYAAGISYAMTRHNEENASLPKPHGRRHAVRRKPAKGRHHGRVTYIGARRTARIQAFRQLVADGLFEDDDE